ncbi:class I SAM-dependent methyltransferase [Actinophytocola sp.]|uniref:class I SAM-dependent methyltransferase n=1 Tax=Actinophytocola sp. TaxID=1872138 RepID=UPI002ED65D60
MQPLGQRTVLPAPRRGEPTSDEIEREWRRRARRAGLARVMRASQPEALAAAVTVATERQLAAHLRAVECRLRRPLRGALEVGCGIGRLTPTIAALAERVLAVDMTEEMLVEARIACAGLANVTFHQCTAQRLPVCRPPMDVAVCVWVLMHVLDDEGLAEACRRIAASATHLVLVEYDHAAAPVGRYARLRTLEEYLAMLPGATIVERGEVYHGGDRSFSALVSLDQS